MQGKQVNVSLLRKELAKHGDRLVLMVGQERLEKIFRGIVAETALTDAEKKVLGVPDATDMVDAARKLLVKLQEPVKIDAK